MSESLGTAVLELTTDDVNLSKGLSGAKSHTDRLVGAMSKAAKLGAIGLGVALGAAAKIGIDEFMQAEKVQAQTEAALKATGGAANVTKAHIEKLAGALMKMSGVDDEAVQSAENLMLTFRNVRNEVGRGNDVFDQATRATLDMSVAMGQDLSSSSILVGKALNDPIRGMSTLQRVGVTFTDSQHEAVKAMVESGDTMKAQKLILGELTKEFGGSAEAVGKTLPGQLSIARESFNNFAGALVERMIPALEAGIAVVRDHWPEIRLTISNAWAQIKPILTSLGELVGMVAGLIRDHSAAISRNFEALKTIISSQLAIVRNALKLVVDLLHGDWAAAWTDAKAIVSNAVTGIVTLLTNSLANVKGAALAIGKGIVSGISAGLSSLAGALEDLIRRPLNAIIAAWNAIGIGDVHLPSVDSHIPGVGKIGGGTIPGFHVPQIRPLAAGGLVRMPTLAMVGEAGPEAVIPLKRLNTLADRPIVINVNGAIGNHAEIAFQIGRELQRLNGRGINFQLT